MVKKSKNIFILILAASFLLAAAGAGAQEKMPQAPGQQPMAKPYPTGQVNITWKAIGRGVGIHIGEGSLSFEGQQYNFKIKGLQLGMGGFSKVTARGDVYNLFDIGQFPGNYVEVAVGLAIFKGKEGVAFKNSQGVHLLLKAEEKGVAIEAGPGGFIITLEEVR